MQPGTCWQLVHCFGVDVVYLSSSSPYTLNLGLFVMPCLNRRHSNVANIYTWQRGIKLKARRLSDLKMNKACSLAMSEDSLAENIFGNRSASLGGPVHHSNQSIGYSPVGQHTLESIYTGSSFRYKIPLLDAMILRSRPNTNKHND